VNTQAQADDTFLRRALDLARKGIGLTSPNPCVGAVIVDSSGAVAGEGSHTYEGVKHAEILAFEQAGERARGATLYINLEPCSHVGRTGPCADALIAAGIKRVVACMDDPNPAVSGKGFERLRAAGIAVTSGILEEEARTLNEWFAKYIRRHTPLITLKAAMTLDGKIAPPAGESRNPTALGAGGATGGWITSDAARTHVHELRHQHDAIMAGVGTVIADDPLLTDRSGRPRRRPLLRVILDSRLRLPNDYQLSQTAREQPVLLFTSSDAEPASELKQLGVEMVRIEGGARDLLAMMNELAAREIQSVLAEGGGTLAGALMDAGLIDKVTFFIAPMIIGGLNAPTAVAGTGASRIKDAFQLEDIEVTQRGRDVEVTGYPRSKDEG